MKQIAITFLLLLALPHGFAADERPLDENLAGLKPFLGSWRGEFKRSTPENPIIDVALWERALNGKAVRITHSINEGAYGGESLVTWDAEKKAIIYHYFTTAGFQTKGTMQMNGKTLECHEIVTGNADGTTEVKATLALKEDGTMSSSAKYLKNGSWEQGHEATYKRAEGAKPVFK